MNFSPRLIAYALAGLALIGALWWIRHTGYLAGVESQRQTISDLRRDLDQAKADVSTLSNTLADVNRLADQQKQEAARQAEIAVQAVAAADKAKADAALANKAWADRFDAAANDKTCSVLKENLCDSVMDY